MKLPPTTTITTLLTALTVLPTTTTAATTNTTCYFLDGTVASADVPCTSDSTTNCCNKNDLCMSNGLCYMQGSRGMALSRGSCTDKSWGARCFAPCSSTNRGDGYPLVNVGYSGSSSKYCCGAVTYKDNEITCAAEGDPFSIDFGTAIDGVAGLAGKDTSSTTSASSTATATARCESAKEEAWSRANHDVAIGAGVGVPLGVIAVASIAWALWERRQRTVAERVGTVVSGKEGGEEYMNLNVMGGVQQQQQPVELVDSRPVLSELDGGKVHGR
ncbi:hypothetical protein BBP40_007956 [Aspergillus hancockii]|nr:hypothetical protein BBP40_007956 [Aspergillus hancockii]